jgi:ABC-type glycerol-3-phosphate transport system permease component
VIWTILASVNLVCALLSYSLLAYAIARLRWRGRGIPFVLLAIILCAQAWLVPQLISRFALDLNAVLYWIWFADWLVCAFSILLLWQTLKNISRDCVDAARMDGCGAFGIYWHVVLPLVRPTLLFLAILTLMATAGDLLARGLEHFQGQALYIVTSLSFLIVSSAIMTIPLIVIFFAARRLLPAQKFYHRL